MNLVYQDTFKYFEAVECSAGAERDRRQWIFGNRDRKAGFLSEQFVEVFKQCAAAGQDDAAIDDIGGQFRRGLFQRDFDRFNDRIDLL